MDKVAELLEKLATKLSVTVEYLWPRLLEYVKYDWLITQVVLSVGLLCTLPLLFFLIKKGREDYDHEEFYFVGALLLSFVSCLLAVGWFVGWSNMSVLWFPEPHALKYLVGLK